MAEKAVPFELLLQDGHRVATNGASSVVLMAPPADGCLFLRRAIKRAGSPKAEQVEWAVAELDGVRVYVDGSSVIVTRDDLYP